MKKLLMVCYGGGHVKIIAPLYLALKDKYDVTILALTVSGHYLEQLNIPFIRLCDFSELITEEVIAYGEMLVNKNENTEIVPFRESIAYHGLSLKDLVETEGSESKAIEKYNEFGRSCFLPINTFKYIINSLSPALVLATNAPRGERAALISAKKLSIPTICINDNAWVKNGIKEVADLNCADVICVLSEEVKAALISASSFREERIVVTGTPVFDNLKKLDTVSLKAKGQVTILLADCELPKKSSFYPNVEADEQLGYKIRCKLNELAHSKKWNVVFRPHPTQKCNYNEFKNIIVSQQESSLHELLVDVDVIVTAISTVGLEGKALGIGLVSIEGSVYRALGSYEKLGLSTGVWGEEELESAIISELNKNVVNSILYEGIATTNIERVIESLLY